MSNKKALHRPGRDRAVATLLRHREEYGSLNASDYQQAAQSCGYSSRQLRRMISAIDDFAGVTNGASPASGPFRVDEDVITEVMLTCGNLANAHRRLQDKQTKVPSLSTFKRKVKLEMGATQLAYAKNASTLSRIKKVYLQRTPESRGHSYLLDHTELPIYVIPDGHKTAVRPWMTVVMDAATRYVLSWVITFGTPSAEEVRAALMSAFTQRTAPDGHTTVGGLPNRCVWDRGLDFLSDLVTNSILELKVTPVALPAYSPHLKGALERFWRHVKENALAPLPGYTDAGHDLAGNLLHAKSALSEQAFLLELATWMDWRTTQHIIRTIGCTSLAAWKRDPAPLRHIAHDQLWQNFLLSNTKMKVGNAGVRFRKIDYVALSGELDAVFGLNVEVRYLPNDRTFIEVFHQGNHVATCYPAQALRPDDQVAFFEARRQKDAEAQKQFTLANKIRTEHPDATAIKKFAKKGQKTRYDVTTPDLDLFAGADEALKKYRPTSGGETNGQQRLL